MPVGALDFVEWFFYRNSGMGFDMI